MKKKFFQSPNFWIAVLLVFGGFFVGFPSGAAADSVAAIFGGIGSIGLLFKFFKDKPQTQAKPWLTDANFWNYLSVIFISVAPIIVPQVLPAVQDIVQNLFRGNWGGALMGAVSLVTIIIKLFQSQQAAQANA